MEKKSLFVKVCFFLSRWLVDNHPFFLHGITVGFCGKLVLCSPLGSLAIEEYVF